MRVLIVAPKFTESPGDFYQFPLGLGYISSALKRAGHEVHCLNCNQFREDPVMLVEQTVRAINPDVCATGGLSPFLPKVRDIFAAARRAKPTIINIAGGGCLSSDPEAGPMVMDIDAGVIGEGEETIVDLCDALETGRDLSGVMGIVYKDAQGTARRTIPRPAIMDLGSVAWPDYEGFGFGEIIDLQRPTDNYFFHTMDRPRSVDMITSRSCPYRCTFCFHPTGKVYRERPLDDFFAELDHLVARYRINMVAVIDELFSLKRQRLLEFCERIKPYKLQWMVQLHVNVADNYILDAMKDAGCTYISYGIESMSQDILISMKKKSKKERISLVMESTYNKKIGIQGNLIFGDTNETLETANESLDWWANNRHYMVNINRLQVYPGSPDYIEAVRDGLITNRVGYIESQFVDLNISKMNDEDLSILSTKIWTAQSSLLNLVKATIFEKEPEPDPIRKELHRIAWDCPRCQHHNDYRGVLLNASEFKNSLRLTCRGCLSRFDIENANRVKFEDHYVLAELDGLFAQAKSLIDAGDQKAAVAALQQIITRGSWYWPAQTELGRHYAAAGDRPMAVRHYGAAVQENPYEPQCHVLFADLMVQERSIGLALLHYRQALLLDPENAEAARKLAALEAEGWTEKEYATYCTSYSETPPPRRLENEVSGCGGKRKGETEFPDIAALEVKALQKRHENGDYTVHRYPGGHLSHPKAAQHDEASAIDFVCTSLPAGRIMVYGAGTHTARLMDALAQQRPDVSVTTVLDRNASLTGEFRGCALRPPNWAVTGEADWIVVAHPLWEMDMIEVLLSHGMATEKLFSVYSNPDFAAYTSKAKERLSA
ncbi:radical SAM protein [Azospirillum sp. TSO35-2]|uniref:B12-binding domain-containing radical SAM protein n=1 Tax=Azospirillum sp. TSO35-2 TaxID=716796 RepID=UPI000D64535B|nr:radical SAM protein [Azospirillum sp. TSO35-2]